MSKIEIYQIDALAYFITQRQEFSVSPLVHEPQRFCILYFIDNGKVIKFAEHALAEVLISRFNKRYNKIENKKDCARLLKQSF